MACCDCKIFAWTGADTSVSGVEEFKYCIIAKIVGNSIGYTG